jgi:hypothetical protein
MNLHILFCPSQATSPRGDALPTEPLSLQLEEEVQQRCAGFIQSCIEQYAELLEDGSRAEGEEPESEHDDSSEEEEPAPTAKDGKGKGKGKSSTKTRAKSPVTPGAFLSVSTTLMPTLARRPSPDEIVARARISIHGDGIDVFARDSCGGGALQA